MTTKFKFIVKWNIKINSKKVDISIRMVKWQNLPCKLIDLSTRLVYNRRIINFLGPVILNYRHENYRKDFGRCPLPSETKPGNLDGFRKGGNMHSGYTVLGVQCNHITKCHIHKCFLSGYLTYINYKTPPVDSTPSLGSFQRICPSPV